MNDININSRVQMSINIVSSLVAFVVNICINFFLSPYIVKTLGVEANGFISLANTFITYASLVTIALNSMAGRFITIEVHKENYQKANKYYNAVFWGNLFIVLLLIIPACLCIFKLENIINISTNLIWDVKMLFTIIFINFFIVTGTPKWSLGTFVTNKLYLQSIRGIQGNIIKVVIIIGLFSLFSPHIFYLGLVTLVISIFTITYDFYYKTKLLPNLVIRKKYFDIKAMKELIVSGWWNTLTQAGNMLLSGLDLLIANLFINPLSMGVLALAKTIPTIILNLAGTITNIFAPSLTIDYAKGNKLELKKNIKSGMKLTGGILIIPLTGLIIFGKEFYSLWVPNEDATMLYVTSLLTCFGLIFTAGTQCLNNIFMVTNKVKVNSIFVLISGAISTLIVFILVKTTDLGIYAIAGVSSCINLLRNMFYTVPYTAKYLGLKKSTFIPEVISAVISVIVLCALGFVLKLFINVNSWVTFFIAIICFSIIALLTNYLIILDKSEKQVILNIIKGKINK